jgi:ATP-dependent Clp protease ATP-binding subunit ClpX
MAKRATVKEGDGVPECTFCGRREDQVRMLLHGPDVRICDRCVGVCNRLLHEAGVPVSAEASGRPASRPRRRRTIWQRLGISGA